MTVIARATVLLVARMSLSWKSGDSICSMSTDTAASARVRVTTFETRAVITLRRSLDSEVRTVSAMTAPSNPTTGTQGMSWPLPSPSTSAACKATCSRRS